MEGIGFQNMKVFKKNQWFDFKNITMLTGTNNSGKSSIINAMQMLQENINANNIDELIKTEFRLTANKFKYGSIESFVNNQSKGKNEYFEFVRNIGSIEYRVKVNVVKGLESYGSVKSIKAIDHKTREQLFILDVKSPYPKYKCVFNINYKYFVDRFYEKCLNSEKLRQRIVELDELLKQVNKGEIQLQELEKKAQDVSQEVSVYVCVHESGYTIDQLDTIGHIDNKYTYTIHGEEMAHEMGVPIIDEIRVFYMEKKDERVFRWSGFISEAEYNNLYAPAFKYGIFDFKRLLETNHDIKIEFESLIKSFYKKDVSKSYKMLCDDIITTLSHTSWEMQEGYSEEFGLSYVPSCLTETYINSLPDFGLIASQFNYKKKRESQVGKNVVANQFIDAVASINKKDASIKKLENSGFYKDIYLALSKILFEKFKEDDRGFSKRKQIIQEPVFHEIYSDISQKIINIKLEFDNIYVSSNRFITKRTYNFNDNSDFTNLLKQVENLKGESKEACIGFINKWLKEFDIADNLVLKPDTETGNFKAYLKVKGIQMLLADYGLGTNQLLPIIFSLGIHSYLSSTYYNEITPRTVVIEEPEANLHPTMQSKLADMFLDATKKFEVKIIAETHSEYLIRKLQYLVADNQSKANSDDIVIYYFYKPDHPAVLSGEVEQVEKIEIDETGRLSKEFGTGFFDEALNWKFELMKLKNLN